MIVSGRVAPERLDGISASAQLVAGYPAHIVRFWMQESDGSFRWFAPSRCGASGRVVTPRTGFTLAAFRPDSAKCIRCFPGLAQRRAA